jgi:carbonic anhydrase
MVQENMKFPWKYDGVNGPEHWGDLCGEFAAAEHFPLQSPIKMNHDEALIKEKGTCTLSFQYEKQLFTEKEFKNTFHFIPIDLESHVEYKGENYYLTDVHFHMPSEHFVDGAQHPLEIHLVHMNSAGRNLVVGTFWQIVDDVSEILPLVSTMTHLTLMDPNAFRSPGKGHFHYVGSLTTPPTSGPIEWFVFDRLGQASNELVSYIKVGMPCAYNNRPTQPLKDRQIKYCTGD